MIFEQFEFIGKFAGPSFFDKINRPERDERIGKLKGFITSLDNHRAKRFPEKQGSTIIELGIYNDLKYTEVAIAGVSRQITSGAVPLLNEDGGESRIFIASFGSDGYKHGYSECVDDYYRRLTKHHEDKEFKSSRVYLKDLPPEVLDHDKTEYIIMGLYHDKGSKSGEDQGLSSANVYVIGVPGTRTVETTVKKIHDAFDLEL